MRKSRSVIAELRYASTESRKLVLRKLRCASENIKFKVRFLFCSFYGLNSHCVLMRCAFRKILFVPASENYFFLSTVYLLKKKNVILNVDNKI